MALIPGIKLDKEAAESIRAQARLRIKLGFPVLLMIALGLCFFDSHSTEEVWEISAFFVAYSSYNLGALVISRRQRPLTLRQIVVITAVLDPLLLSAALSLLGDGGQVLICFYLFTILGFGFRIGTTAMWICQASSLVGFTCVTWLVPIWWNNPLMTLANFILLFVVPTYATVLIKKLRDARAFAEHENQAKSQLLANVSHELRTPLTGITSSAMLLKDETRDLQVSRRCDTILRLAKDLMSEIDNLLDSEKYAANALKLEATHFQLRDVMEQLRLTLAPSTVGKGIGFSVSVDERIRSAVSGDAHYLLRVLMNIGGNAVKFTETGRVDINLALVEDHADAYLLRFTCTDTGIGIPAPMHQKVFDRFFQVSGGTTRKYGGTGLGMSIASEIVSLMGGKLTLQSEPGRGSVFSFEIRLLKAISHASRSVAVQPAEVVRGKHILVADDNSTILMLLKEMLERDDHRVTTATSGKGAVDCLSRTVFDLALLDYNMGDIDGATVLQIHRFGKIEPAPCYILTADTTLATARRLKECGALGVLHKPISSDTLRAAIASVHAGAKGMPLSMPAPASAPASIPASAAMPVPASIAKATG
ncbi:MAG: ATP-binding protein, partial [Janthinobacterium lividum]